VDSGSAIELAGTEKLPPVHRGLDADHGFLSLLLGSCMMPSTRQRHNANAVSRVEWQVVPAAAGC
jgi:hypothetical protein